MTDNKKKGIIFVVFIAIIAVFFMVKIYRDNRSGNEEQLLENMKEDEAALVVNYSIYDFTADEWIGRYRDLGISFINYSCEYGGSKTDIQELTELYRIYGDKIIEISNLLEVGNHDEAKVKLQELTTFADEVEEALEAAYEKYT